MTYTREDFEIAEFAKHPDGRLAHRLYNEEDWDWAFEREDGFTGGDKAKHDYMVAFEWVPFSWETTLESLHKAWSNAEGATEENPVREGDEMIIRMPRGGFIVREADDLKELGWVPIVDNYRILNRAPRSEPWKSLAEVIWDTGDIEWGDAQDIAKRLHGAGHRVTKEEGRR